MTLYSQRDPRWRAVQLGTSGRSMAQIGCMVTSIAMLSDYFKPAVRPDDVVITSKFTSGGLLIWGSLQLLGFKFSWRGYDRNDHEIMRHLKDKDLAVLLQVADKTHWVVATGRDFFSGLYKIADPLYGDRATMKRYQDNITGAAYFKRA